MMAKSPSTNHFPMDLIVEETSSPLQGFKYVKPFSNFFQAAKQRFANEDPESAVHLVGPMFELTACIDNEKNLMDFDAYYPESGVTFGPTICSFGLSYNDHNYALPVGLTPPAMAPHLMDLKYPAVSPHLVDVDMNIMSTPQETSVASKSDDNISADNETKSTVFLNPRCLIKNKLMKSPGGPSTKLITSPTAITPLVFASLADSTAGLSEPKKTLFAAWHAKAAASGGTLLVQQRWQVAEGDEQQSSPSVAGHGLVKDQAAFSVPRYCKGLLKVPDTEGGYRCDLDMKVIEVPDDICVSPSKLSDLESSDDCDEGDDEDDSSTVPYLSPGHSVDKMVNARYQSALWSSLRCICDVKVGDSKMLHCIKCGLLQHVECMEAIYEKGVASGKGASDVPLSEESDGTSAAGLLSKETLMEPSSYLCEVCLQPPFIPDPAIISRLRSAALKRQATRILDFEHVSEGASKKTIIGGAQLLASATDRARQLGLIGGPGGSRGSVTSSDLADRQSNETTDVNLRIPSPPRASKRKQDLTTSSYNPDSVRSTGNTHADGEIDSLNPSATTTTPLSHSAASTPANTPLKPFPVSHHHYMKVYSVGDDMSSPSSQTPPQRSDCNSQVSADTTPIGSPMMVGKAIIESHRRKCRRTLFPDSPGLRKATNKRCPQTPSTFGSAWAKDYKEADVSVYSENLLACISERIASGRERIQRLPPTSLGRTPLCRVVMFDHNDKGLEASARLGKGEVVTEVRGNLMLREEYEHFVDPMNEYNRYVMMYNYFADRVVAIITSQYGNDARFIRRSCIANCALDHFVVGTKLRIIIRTTQELMPGVELTIPFDSDYRSCCYTLKCACARSRCPVQKWCRKLARHKVMPNLDYGKFIESRLNALSRTISDDQPTTPVSRSFSPSPGPSPITSTNMAAAGCLSYATEGGSPMRFTASPSMKPSTTNPPYRRLFTPTKPDPSPPTPPLSTVGDGVFSKKRPIVDVEPTTSEPAPKTIAKSSTDHSVPPFKPIITTRRQAAQAASLSSKK